MIAKKKTELKFESVKSQIFKLLKYNTGIVNIGLEVQAIQCCNSHNELHQLICKTLLAHQQQLLETHL